MYDKKSLGKRIKAVRKAKGFTQEQLAESIGIDPKHLSRVECGINLPSIDLLTKIANTLKTEPFVLFQTTQDKSKKEIIKNINEILETAHEDKVRTFYRVLLDIVS